MGIQSVGSWGVRRPFAFAVLFCIPLAVLFLTLASVAGEVFRHQFPFGNYFGVSAALLFGSLVFLLLIRRFDWTDASGMGRPPSSSWLVIVPPLVYVVTANFYVSSRSFDLDFLCGRVYPIIEHCPSIFSVSTWPQRNQQFL